MAKKNKMKTKPFACQLSMEGKMAILTVSGCIGWDTDPIDFNASIDQAKDAGCTELMIVINSMGGYCYDGLAMGDKLKTCGMKTRAVVCGTAQSMASYLLCCCEERVAHKNATIMVHQPYAGIYGNVDDLKAQADSLVKLRDTMMADYGAVCGMSGEEFSEAHRVQKNYTAEEALALGLLTGIEGSEEKKETDDAGEETDGEPLVAVGGTKIFDYGMLTMALAMSAEEEDGESDAEEEDGQSDAGSEEETEEDTPAGGSEEGSEGGAEEGAAEEAKAYVTRAEVEEMMAAAFERGRAAAVADGAAQPGQLPGCGEPMAAGGLTVEALMGMPVPQRLHMLAMHPELQDEYRKRAGI